jgi:hypothetical protein
MSSEHRRLVIDAGSNELRRQLGPTGWVVFEELLLASTGPSADCHATVSVRALAGELGLAKDTVARALVRLRHAGLVSAHQSRAASGAFATGGYTLTFPSSIDVDDHVPPAAPRVSRSRSRRQTSASTVAQLALAIEA